MRLLHRFLVACAAVLAAAPMLTAIAPAASASAPVATAGQVQISEVESNGGHPDDWIELHNLTGTDLDLTGWWLQDNVSSDHYDIATGTPGNTVIPANGYRSFDVSFDDTLSTPAKGASPQYFGLGGADSARLYDPANTRVDEVSWTAHADDPITGGGGSDPDATYSRCAGSYGETGWVVTDQSSKATANACPAAATVDAALEGALHVNELMASNVNDQNGDQEPDWIELTNTGTVSQDVSGWVLADDKATDHDYLSPGTVIDPGAHPSWNVGVSSSDTTYASSDLFLSQTFPGKTNKDFGLGAGGDNGALLFPDDLHDVDRVSYGSDADAVVAAAGTGRTIGRCPDGTGAWAVTFAASMGAANVCGNPVDSQVKINEVDPATGTVELVNTSASVADISGLTLTDAGGDRYTVPASTTVAAGGYQALNVSGSLHVAAGGDTVTLLDGSTSIDTTSWTHALTTSWGRCPDATGTFADTAAATDGAANNCAAPAPTGWNAIRISEVETNGDPLGDWIEITNVGTAPVNVSGMILADDGSDGGTDNGTVSGHFYAIPGTNDDPSDTTTAGNNVLPAGGYEAFYESNSFPFGLGGPDMARIFTPDHVLVDSTAWPSHESGVTYERCPQATQGVVFRDSADNAPFINSWTNSPGAANDCLPPVRINEVQASDPSGGNDWVELTNVGDQPVDLAGYLLADDKDSDEYVISAADGDTTTLAPGGFASYNVDATTHPGNFGLGKTGDEVRLYEPGAYDGSTRRPRRLLRVRERVGQGRRGEPAADGDAAERHVAGERVRPDERRDLRALRRRLEPDRRRRHGPVGDHVHADEGGREPLRRPADDDAVAGHPQRPGRHHRRLGRPRAEHERPVLRGGRQPGR